MIFRSPSFPCKSLRDRIKSLKRIGAGSCLHPLPLKKISVIKKFDWRSKANISSNPPISNNISSFLISASSGQNFSILPFQPILGSLFKHGVFQLQEALKWSHIFIEHLFYQYRFETVTNYEL